jgi:hypothetical protein
MDRCRINTRPPRTLHNDEPPLGARAIMRELEALATARCLVGARVGYKRNAAGDHVVALIFQSFERR